MKFRYLFIFFLIWYFLNGLTLTFVFKKSDIFNEKDVNYLACVYEVNNDHRSSLEKCGGDICPGNWCFPPEVSSLGFFIHPDSYKYTFTWPAWLVDEIIYPKGYNGETGTSSRIFFGRPT